MLVIVNVKTLKLFLELPLNIIKILKSNFKVFLIILMYTKYTVYYCVKL